MGTCNDLANSGYPGDLIGLFQLDTDKVTVASVIRDDINSSLVIS
jgi:hypothetical protein